MSGFETFNWVLEQAVRSSNALSFFEKVSKKMVPSYAILNRRTGDIASCYCSTYKADKTLAWRSKLTLIDMCSSGWEFQSRP